DLQARLASPGRRITVTHWDAFSELRGKEAQPRLPFWKSEIEGAQIVPLHPSFRNDRNKLRRIYRHRVIVAERAQHSDAPIVDATAAGARAVGPVPPRKHKTPNTRFAVKDQNPTGVTGLIFCKEEIEGEIDPKLVEFGHRHITRHHH